MASATKLDALIQLALLEGELLTQQALSKVSPDRYVDPEIYFTGGYDARLHMEKADSELGNEITFSILTLADASEHSKMFRSSFDFSSEMLEQQ